MASLSCPIVAYIKIRVRQTNDVPRGGTEDSRIVSAADSALHPRRILVDHLLGSTREHDNKGIKYKGQKHRLMNPPSACHWLRGNQSLRQGESRTSACYFSGQLIASRKTYHRKTIRSRRESRPSLFPERHPHLSTMEHNGRTRNPRREI